MWREERLSRGVAGPRTDKLRRTGHKGRKQVGGVRERLRERMKRRE